MMIMRFVVGGTCGTYGSYEKCIRSFVEET
jgi:hypothetical protein